MFRNRFFGLTFALAGFTSAPVLAGDEKGFLGIGMKDGRPSGAVVTTLLPERAGARAGLEVGDLIVRINSRSVPNQFEAVTMVKGYAAGSTVQLTIVRRGKAMVLPVELDAHPTAKFATVPVNPHTATPTPITNSRMTAIGARLEMVDPFLRTMMKVKEGVYVTEIAPGSAAAKAGLKVNDVVLRIDNRSVSSVSTIGQAFAGKQPGQSVTLSVVRAGKRYRAVVAIDATYTSR